MNIAITGPESCGKSTIAKLLAQHFDCSLVEEYAREYLESLERDYTKEDLDFIANEQFLRWNIEAKNNLLICDTEMIVLKIWSEYKYSDVSNNITEKLDNQFFDIYFLCKPDIPWEEDVLRENPDNRDALFDLYLKELTERKLNFVVLEGSIDTRLELAVNLISLKQKE